MFLFFFLHTHTTPIIPTVTIYTSGTILTVFALQKTGWDSLSFSGSFFLPFSSAVPGRSSTDMAALGTKLGFIALPDVVREQGPHPMDPVSGGGGRF